MKDITHPDYMHSKRVCKDFKIRKLGDYHDLHVQSDTLLLGDVFENFQNICFEINELDPRLAWQAGLIKTKVKVDLLTDIYMLLMVGKGIRGGICHAINRYAKLCSNHMKDYDKNK